jgi:hypothetical protein
MKARGVLVPRGRRVPVAATKEKERRAKPRERGRQTRYPGVKQLDSGVFLIDVRVTDPRAGRRIREEQTVEAPAALEASKKRGEWTTELVGSQKNDRPLTNPFELRTAVARGLRQQRKCEFDARPQNGESREAILPFLGQHIVQGIDRGGLKEWTRRVSKRRMNDGERYAQETVLGWWKTLHALVPWVVEDFDLRATQRHALRRGSTCTRSCGRPSLFIELALTAADAARTPLRDPAELNEPLCEEVDVVLDVAVYVVEELMERDEARSLHIPVRMLALGLKVDRVGETLIQELGVKPPVREPLKPARTTNRPRLWRARLVCHPLRSPSVGPCGVGTRPAVDVAMSMGRAAMNATTELN